MKNKIEKLEEEKLFILLFCGNNCFRFCKWDRGSLGR